MPALAATKAGPWGNANPAMNSDIVKPIPAITPTDPSCPQETPSGMVANPPRIASQDESKIPIGFPRSKPTHTTQRYRIKKHRTNVGIK